MSSLLTRPIVQHHLSRVSPIQLRDFPLNASPAAASRIITYNPPCSSRTSRMAPDFTHLADAFASATLRGLDHHRKSDAPALLRRLGCRCYVRLGINLVRNASLGVVGLESRTKRVAEERGRGEG